MLRKGTILLVALALLAAGTPATGADRSRNAAVPSFWEYVTATVSQLWIGGTSRGYKTCEAGPTIDPSGCPRSAATPPTCEGGRTIDPLGCPSPNRLLPRETAGAAKLLNRSR